jgi:hypothetical protein
MPRHNTKAVALFISLLLASFSTFSSKSVWDKCYLDNGYKDMGTGW